MASWDKENKQILSTLCKQCTDKRFVPRFADLENVGCCRYEPVFTLFEIYKMVQDGREKFFFDHIYDREDNTIYPYEIMVHAKLDDRFMDPLVQREYDRLSSSKHTIYKAMELKTSYSVCSFFVSGRGCGLDSRYKTSICRSFVCDTIQRNACSDTKKSINLWQREIREECEEFNRAAERELRRRRLQLQDHVHEVIAFLKNIEYQKS